MIGFIDVRSRHFYFMKMRLSTKTKANGYVNREKHFGQEWSLTIIHSNAPQPTEQRTKVQRPCSSSRTHTPKLRPPHKSAVVGRLPKLTTQSCRLHTPGGCAGLGLGALSAVLTQITTQSGSLVDQGLCPWFCPSDCILPTYSRRKCDEPKWQEYSISEHIS